ncbi:MAG: RagB/SusD family nutrient uptake outer membrane protein [Bacteroidales bacterium]|nr:RagB/SusD family nutrient uptake outer membrane protein [Bacteroidales bacterium]
MKKSLIITAVALVGASLTGCEDFLNDNRYPLSQQTVNSEFWSNPENVQNQVNYFYQDFLGYGNGTGSGDFYFKWTTDDQCGRTSFANWLNLSVPATSTNYTAPYTEIRRACLIIAGVEGGTITGAEAENFIAQARLHRARNYFTLVKRYGDVPLIKEVLDPAMHDELYMARTPRNEVMDFVLEDLDYAVAHISAQSGKTVFSKDMARAVKAEICLYEGSYAKYHQKDNARATKFFTEVVNAAEPIAKSYPVCDDYTSLYKSFRTAGGGYDGLTNNSEVIFMKAYEESVLMHSTLDYSCASDGIAGITRDAFDSFLLLTGELSSNATDKGVLAADGKSISIQNLLDVRDQRLAMTTYPNLLYPGMSWAGPNTAPMWSMTGYGVAKYDNWTVPNSDATTANRSWTCAPLFWGARLYLAILEAKAELGTITDTDLTNYMAPLWKRAKIDLSKCTIAHLNSLNDPANDVNVSSLIWEIRRCRRCELMMDDDIRYWDLVRWHMLDHLDTHKYPKIIQGANISMAPAAPEAVLGEYLDCSYGQSREFNERQYFFPIPSNQISINSAIKQNPGW